MILSGCANITSGDIGPEITTNVVLSEANFVVVNSVEGSATDRRIAGLGLSNRRLYARAKRDLVEEAELIGQSRALVNVTVDVESSFAWFIQTRRVTLSAEVVEFYNGRLGNGSTSKSSVPWHSPPSRLRPARRVQFKGTGVELLAVDPLPS